MGNSHPGAPRLQKINTGVLVAAHSDKHGKHGVGAAAIARIPGSDALYIAGNGGLAVFNVQNQRQPIKVGATINTGCITQNSGAAMLVDHKARTMYLAGGK